MQEENKVVLSDPCRELSKIVASAIEEANNEVRDVLSRRSQ